MWFKRYWPWAVPLAWMLGYEAFAVITHSPTLSQLVWRGTDHWAALPFVVTSILVLLWGHFWLGWWKK